MSTEEQQEPTEHERDRWSELLTRAELAGLL